ncbi:MAG: hypothetical protein ACFCVD_06370 [Nodosilinea sp.]
MTNPTMPTAAAKSISNRQLYPAIAGSLILALAGGAALKLLHNHRVSSEAFATTAEVEADDAPEVFQSTPFFKPAPAIRLASPSLLRSTSSQARVESVAAGRPDPFAPVILPGSAPTRPTAAAVTPVGAVTPGQPLPTVPVVATQSLPPLPQVVPLPNLPAPFVAGSVPQAPAQVAVAPSASPTFTSLVDQVVVSGVVQVGNGVSVIITEPGSTVSRRVAQGDWVAGGRIRVKSVDMSGQEPVVVLTYDGKDYFRTVGSAALVSSL